MTDIPIDGSTRFDNGEPTHTVTRFHREGDWQEVILTGLTLEQARAHCLDPESSSATCTHPDNLAYTAEHGDWFDGWHTD